MKEKTIIEYPSGAKVVSRKGKLHLVAAPKGSLRDMRLKLPKGTMTVWEGRRAVVNQIVGNSLASNGKRWKPPMFRTVAVFAITRKLTLKQASKLVHFLENQISILRRQIVADEIPDGFSSSFKIPWRG